METYFFVLSLFTIWVLEIQKKSIILHFQPEEDDEELELEYLRRRPGDERRGPGDLCGDLLRGGGDLERLGDLLGERLLGGDLRLGGERRLGGDRRRGGDLLRPPPPQERDGEPNGLPWILSPLGPAFLPPKPPPPL